MPKDILLLQGCPGDAPYLFFMDTFVSVELVWPGERFVATGFPTCVRTCSSMGPKLNQRINISNP